MAHGAFPPAIETLATEFVSRFPATLTGLRTVGREAEYPVVTANGEAADVRRLWEPLGEYGDLQAFYDSPSSDLIVKLSGPDYSYALEVGVGTIEINTRPCAHLSELQAIHTEAVTRLVEVAAQLQWRVLAYGMQPITPPRPALMSPKQRYAALYKAMGEDWLWYTVTASDQVQIDVCQSELVQILNVGNLIAPVLVALCANSPIYAGGLSPFCSGREGEMMRIRADEVRHGMPPRPYTSIAGFIHSLTPATFLVQRDDARYQAYNRPFSHYLQENGPDFAAYLLHEHYVWNSARLRAAYGTVELRPACQQPWPEQMAAVALGLGLMEAAASVQAYVRDVLGSDYWQIMRTYYGQSIAGGLAVAQPAPNFLERMVALAVQGLVQRGQGEEIFLQPILQRLQRAEDPAQLARRVFQKAGMGGLLAHTAI